MSQEHNLGELSASDIARRIGAGAAEPHTSIGERVGAIRAMPPERVRAMPPEPVRPPPPAPVRPPAALPMPARLDAFPVRIASQRIDPQPVQPVSEHEALEPPSAPVFQLSETRRRLIRDTAATLVGVSAVILIALAVAPPPPEGGVLKATATPPAAAERTNAVEATTPEPTGTSASAPSPTPTP